MKAIYKALMTTVYAFNSLFHRMFYISIMILLTATVIAGVARAENYVDFYKEHSKSVVKVCSNLECNRGTGSGVYIGKDLIITNHHVIRFEECVTKKDVVTCMKKVSGFVSIITPKGTYTAQVIRQYPKIDIAVLKLHGDGFGKPVLLGDSSKLQIGEPAITIGSGLGYYNSLGVGYVSGLNRQISLPPYKNIIQVSSGVHPGNSGGPVFNKAGELIAVIYAGHGSFDNIGFAIPINTIINTIFKNPERIMK